MWMCGAVVLPELPHGGLSLADQVDGVRSVVELVPQDPQISVNRPLDVDQIAS